MTKKTKAEVLSVYEKWLHSYLNGDVVTYDSYFDKDYHFIGSTDNEEFLSKRDTTQFFADTAEQLAGKCDLRNETRIIEKVEGLVFITHLFDAWFLNGNDYAYYGRFRFTNALKKNKEGWRFTYQHFSTPDSKTAEGDTIGFDKVSAENRELKDAIKRRTFELEQKNRELEIETALERLRAEAVAMKASSDLLDIVVTMRTEFTKLGHEAHYFWHMMWLPETYEKAMTSGDGSKIGFVMELPRHIHGNIPLLSKWEKSKKPTVVYPMNVEEAIDYVDKMVALGDFKNIDPQAPTHEDIKQIGGLTFIMARTTHGEIGYSLPGVVENPPQEDINILVKFATTFDLAHQRFLDLQKAEKQARETQIELALERVRSKTMAMNNSEDVDVTVLTLFEEVSKLGLDKSIRCGIGILQDLEYMETWSAASAQNGDIDLKVGVLNMTLHPLLVEIKKTWEKGKKSLSYTLEGSEVKEYYTILNNAPEYPLQTDLNKLPNKTYHNSFYFNAGVLFSFTDYPISNEAADVLNRFSGVFGQTYTRFLDLKTAEAQKKEAQIEAAMERVRSRSMAMRTSEELKEVIQVLYDQFVLLNINIDHAGFILDYKNNDDMHIWLADHNAVFPKIVLPYFDSAHWNDFVEAKKTGRNFFSNTLDFEEKNQFYTDLFAHIPGLPEETKATYFGFKGLAISTVLLDSVGLYIENYAGVPFSEEVNQILMRFGKVFQQSYTRFLDLQKAERQARKAQIEAALERTRTQSMLMQHSEELDATSKVFHEQLQLLGIDTEFSYVWLPDEANNEHQFWVAWNAEGTEDISIQSKAIVYPLDKTEPYTASCFEDWESGIPVHLHHIKPKEVATFFSAWEELLKDAKNLTPKYFSNGLYYAEAFMKYGCFGINIKRSVTEEEKQILQRFSLEFERTYTRFLDLQKAEAQAKEAQIEAALERVRSRSMAMHKSEELLEAGELLYRELSKLGIDRLTTGYILFDDKAEIGYSYGVNPADGSIRQQPVAMIHNQTKTMKSIVASWKKQEPLLVIELNEKETIKHQTFIAEKSTNFPLTVAQLLAISPKRLVIHCFNFKQGYLLIVGGNKLSKEQQDMVVRFAKVFQQTYTRFLDLQRAEAQTKEAQIETALERVRSRSMAMHKSDELLDVISLVSEQLEKLGFRFVHVSFANNDNNKSYRFWTAAKGLAKPTRFETPYIDIAVFKNIRNAQEKSLSFFSDIITKEEHWQWHKHLLAHGGSKIFSKEQNDVIKSRGMARSIAINTNIIVIIANYASIPYSEEENKIFDRFGKVFEQSYTRFLDLQRAEIQARDAQIEAALERVRSRSMAMHNSDELREVGDILFNEITNLGIESITSGFVILEDDENIGWNYAPNPSTGKILPVAVGVYHKETPIMRSVLQNWKKQEPVFVVEMGEKETIAHQTFIAERSINFPIGAKELIAVSPKELKLHNFNFLQGYLLIVGGTKLTDEQIDIMRRFTKVFQQTYTRFLDLKKAEAQAREAQIEAALEKVRSRTMAMQHSEELPEAANVLFTEVQHLGIPAWSCGYNILSEDKKSSTCIMSSEGEIQTPFTLPLTEHISLKPWHNAIVNNEQFFVYEQGDKDLEEHYAYMQNLPDLKETFQQLKDAEIPLPTFQVNHLAKFTNGFLLFITYERVPEAHEIFQRFAKVFEQTYTRFLDLQKAEAQARESQIQLSLERVRARTMAMQSSEELVETSELLFQQIKELGIDVWSCGYSLWYDDDSYFIGYNPMPNGKMGEKFKIPLTEDIFFKTIRKGKRAGKDFLVFESKGKSLVKTYDYMDKLPVVGEGMRAIVASGYELPKFQVTHCGYFSHGHLMFITLQHYPDAIDIFKRFTKEFEQAYTRFLDLQKAEAQTRTAQINLAVERVRAKALAMHKSEEIMNVVAKLKDEVMALDIPDVIAATIILSESEDRIRIWDLSTLKKEKGIYQIPFDFTIKLKKRDPNLYIKRVWENPKDYFLELQEANDFVRLMAWLRENNKLEVADEVEEYIKTTNLKQLHHAVKKLNNGKLVIDLLSAPSDEMETILTKMGAAFDLAYKRFEDLKNAEAQTRKAQIEASLERVRAKAMAMHDSNELDEVLSVLCEQFDVLGIVPMSTHMTVFDFENNTFTFRETGKFGNRSFGEQTVALDAMDNWKETVDKWRADKATAINKLHFPKEQLAEVWKVFHESFASMPEGSRITPKDYPHGIYHTAGKHPFGYIGMNQTRPATEEEVQIVIKFANEFGMAYQRFLDLQKAEAQAREAEIEAALERIRARSMAMHKTDELSEVIVLLFRQLELLNLVIDTCYIDIFDEDNRGFNIWVGTGTAIYPKQVHLPYFKHPIHQLNKKARQNNVKFFSFDEDEKSRDLYFEHFYTKAEGIDVPKERKEHIAKGLGISGSTALGEHAGITMWNYRKIIYSREENEILNRVNKVFQQTYTRFLDLQKAEAQARESQIEAALEKVRSHSLAMHKPDELQAVVALIAEKLRDLGVIFDAGGVILCTYFPDNKDVMHWIAAEDFSYSGNYLVPYFDTTIFKDTWESKNSGDTYFSKEFSVEDKNSFFEYAFEHSDYKHFPDAFKQHALEAKNHRITAAWSKNSAILIPSFTEVIPSKSDADILKRFAKVFEQAYIRFMDLQKAEERARETQIDIALERVRSRTMGMQKSDELAETSAVLFQQIKELASETWSCGFCIWQDNDEVELWMGADSGGLLPPMLIPYKKEPTHREIHEASLRKESSYNKVWNGKALKEHYAFLRTIPSVAKAIKVMEDSGLTLPKQQCYYVGFFKHGYLLLITEEPNDNLIDLSQRFTKVFDLTYTRFLDLQLKEKQAVEILNEKQRLEKTLTDLKQTQKQLIQSEKMASLGELTAGIAHEIQNPLNFVNNFSEVSKELLEEMQEELENGDMEEVKAIMDDIIQNLEKINHHGKRADGIVKGMLQHSRASGNKKEPTNINALADEYLRLAYHGLRAKDKSFNAQLVTDFDDDIMMIDVIPQDLGRVILNLLTNAFYAVNEKQKSGLKNYEPTVSIHTKKIKDNIEIKVTDNGNGMPNEVKEKIFQPFFTTKPTGQGTGLGLSMSYDIVTKGHNGQLKVDTKKGENTTFTILIPNH